MVSDPQARQGLPVKLGSAGVRTTVITGAVQVWPVSVERYAGIHGAPRTLCSNKRQTNHLSFDESPGAPFLALFARSGDLRPGAPFLALFARSGDLRRHPPTLT
jgi:hypothetical protein